MKNKIITKVYLLISILFTVVNYGQTVNSVLEKMNDKFIASNAFRFESKYNLYKDYTSKIVHQNYNGLFLKNAKNEVYMKIGETEFINTNTVSLKVSHSEKAILVSNKQDFSTGTFDINKLIVLCEITSFKDFKTFWQIYLTPKKLSGLNYSHIVVKIDKNYNILEQVFYYNTGFNFSGNYREQQLTKPRLEIKYSGHTHQVSDLIKINPKLYITIKEAGNVLLTPKYKNYEVIDNRTFSTNKNKAKN